MYRANRSNITGAELIDLKTNLKIDLRSLLCSSKEGLSEIELRREYRDLVGREIPFLMLGYNTLYDLMKDLSDICIIKKHYFSNSWIYYPVHDDTTIELGLLVNGQLDKKRAVRKHRHN
jgi:hypothetical protein